MCIATVNTLKMKWTNYNHKLGISPNKKIFTCYNAITWESMLCQSVDKLPKRFSRESNQNSRYKNFNTRTTEILQNTRIFKANCCLKFHKTRMHSSRMRTIRCSGCRGVHPSMLWAGSVYPSMHSAGGMSAQGGVCPGKGGVCPGKGVSGQGGVCPELSARGCLPREEGWLLGGVCLGGVCPGEGGVCPGRVSATNPLPPWTE